MGPQTANQQYQALLEVSRSTSSHYDVKALFRELATLLRVVVQFDYLNLVLYDPIADAMRLHVLEAEPMIDNPPGPPIPVDESPAGAAWKNQQPVILTDTATVTEWPRIMDKIRQHGVRSCCYLPLTTARRRLGALGFGFLEHHDFGEEELRFMMTVAAQVAVAVDNAVSHGELERERDRLRLLLEVTNMLVSSLEPGELFERISESVRRVVPHDYTSLALIDPDRRAVVIRALEMPGARGYIREQMVIPDDGSPAQVAISERSVTVFDAERLHAMETLGSKRLIAEGIQYLVCVPLTTRNGILGTLNLGRSRDEAMSDSDIAILGQVAQQVAIALENALAFRKISELKDRLAEEKLYLEDELRTDRNFTEMVGESVAFRRIVEQIETVAPTEANVLILGETGTGKELIARAIHQYSARRERTFVKINCAAIPTGLLESELFGHERGAFTGAIQQKIGRFELAHEGTLFLDEVGDIPLELQPKLLRAIQEREFERLGSNRTIKVDVRLVSATNRDLPQMVANREFRADLYYRLNVFPIQMPALRDRPEDIPLLVRYFAQKFSRRLNRMIESIPSETMARLMGYSWPGNVRELENLIERAVILSPGPVLRVPDPEGTETPAPSAGRPVTLEAAEREHIVRTLEDTDWVLAGPNGAAARLGMKRSTLQSRMKKLGILHPRRARA